jgi:lysophospholipase L1-like esterase
VNPATKELTWPGTGVSFAFTGTSATIGIASTVGENSADLIIDGGAPILVSDFPTTGVTTPAGLSHGHHTVVLRRRSETAYGTVFLGNITTNGQFTDAAAPPKRQIDIIGDSITVGYGLDGVLPCVNSAVLTDNPKTYAVLAADALNADYHVMAWSGKGIIRNYVTDPAGGAVVPELYTRYGANDADNSYPFPSSWSPEAVVINLGTNDFGYVNWDANGQAYNARDPLNATAYTNATVKFVRDIQKHYPRAHFFLVSSPMLSDSWPTAADAQKTTQNAALKAAAAQIGAKAHFVDWPSQGSDVGCDYHPNAATHAAEGVVLTKAIASALGW